MSGEGKDIYIIDTDAGADDAFAIYLVLNSHIKDNVESIVCTSGNTYLKNVIQNVLKTLSTANFKVPLYIGSDRSLTEGSYPDDYFGKDGFGDFEYKGVIDETLIQQQDGIDHLIDVVKHNPGKVTILCLAPLTNIAKAGMKYANFFKDVKQLVILGGNVGNQDGTEFNFKFDPVAAQFVLNHIDASNPAILVPKETFNSANNNSFSMEFRLNVIGKINTDIVHLFNKAEKVSFSRSKRWRIPDQMGALVMMHPEVITNKILGKPAVDETGNMTVHEGNTVWIVLDIDKEKIRDLLLKSLSSNFKNN